MIAWMYDWSTQDNGDDFAGAFTIPRELKLKDNKILSYPVEEALPLLTLEDELVQVSENSVTVSHPELLLKYETQINEIAVLRDTKTIEVFINGGEGSFSYWFGK